MWMPDDAWWTAAAKGGGNLRDKSAKVRYVAPAHARNLRDAHLAISKQSGVVSTLALVESEGLNAFASSAEGRNTVAVTLDFLDALGNDRDALAATLGHEVAHLHYRHGATRQERATTAQGASHAIGTLLGLVGVPFGGTIASVGVTAVTTSFSRDEEREADAKGLEWATAAGYSACGSAHTIRMLQSKSESASLPFLSTHPGHEERIESASLLSRKLTGNAC